MRHWNWSAILMPLVNSSSSPRWFESGVNLQEDKQEADHFDIAMVGFADDELAALLADDGAFTGLADEDVVPEICETPISVAGELWLLGDHRVLCGDATNTEDGSRWRACRHGVLRP